MLDEYGIFLRNGLILGEDADVNLGRPADAIEPLHKAFQTTEEFAAKDRNDAVSRMRVATQEQHWATSCASAIHGELLPCMT